MWAALMLGLWAYLGTPTAEHNQCTGAFDTFNAAECCNTPTAWREQDSEDPEFWFAVCGTADGRVCGEDVPWTDPACDPDEEP